MELKAARASASCLLIIQRRPNFEFQRDWTFVESVGGFSLNTLVIRSGIDNRGLRGNLHGFWESIDPQSGSIDMIEWEKGGKELRY